MADQQATTTTKNTPAATQTTPSNNHKATLVPALLVILGLLVMIYPVVSTQWNNHKQQVAARAYDKLEKSIPQKTKDETWEKAHEYNRNDGTGPILDPWLSRISPKNAAYAAYLDQLNQTDTMGRIIIPTAKADLPIFHGTDDKTLQKGVGHLYGTDLPVGGPGTHTVLTGHSGLPNATLFDNLRNIKEGDAFYIQVTGHKLKYHVDQIKVVLPNETADLQAEDGKDYATLITCTPYGINTHRLLVRGHAVPLDPTDEHIIDKGVGTVWQWWMYALIAIFTAGIATVIWWLMKQRRKEKELENNEEENHEDNEVSTLVDADAEKNSQCGEENSNDHNATNDVPNETPKTEQKQQRHPRREGFDFGDYR